MVASHKPLIIKTIQELQAGVQHLEYSYRKVQKIPLYKDQMENLQTKIIPFLMAVTKRIGDQKIDFAVISKQQSQTDPFWKLALVRSLDF